MTEIRTILIDDEADGRDALRIALEKYFPEVTILEICETPEGGLRAIRKHKPDLVFLDVQMPGQSGFDLLKQLSPVNFQVVFVTAHDQYAIKAIRFSALDYLLKPVDVDDLRNAILKIKERLTETQNTQPVESILHNIHHHNGKIDRIAVPSQEAIQFFNTADIIYCEAEGSYAQLVLKGKKRILVSRNLKDFENLLTESGFCRVHHSFLINLSHVQKYVKGEGGYVIMTDDHHIDISRRKKDEFLRLLNPV